MSIAKTHICCFFLQQRQVVGYNGFMDSLDHIAEQLRAFVEPRFDPRVNSQASIAAKIGYAKSGIHRWVKGETTPSADVFVSILQCLGYDVLAWLRSTVPPSAELQDYLSKGVIVRARKAGAIEEVEIEILKAADRSGVLSGKSFGQIDDTREALRRVLGLEGGNRVIAGLKAGTAEAKPKKRTE
jgi:transcriptional regulator with XRE-family HTH domain